MYSIYVRDLGRCDTLQVETLAVDIADERTAATLVRGIARSFPTHGPTASRSAFWFERGGHSGEIWYEADGKSRPARRSSTHDTLWNRTTRLVRPSGPAIRQGRRAAA